MSFWKDVWVMIALAWVGALAFALITSPPSAGRGRVAGLFVGLVLAVTVACLSRHNAVVLLAPCSLLCGVIALKWLSRPWVLAGLLAPVVAFAGAGKAIDRSLDVKNVQLGSVVMRTELMGVAAEFPELRPFMPHMDSLLADGFEREYVHGFIDLTPRYLKPGRQPDPKLVVAEYKKVFRLFPIPVLYAKYKAFVFHLNDNPCLKFYATIDPNDHGLVQNTRYAETRGWMTKVLWDTFHHEDRGWAFTRHLVWLAADIGAIVGLVGLAWVARRRRYLAAALVMTVPLAYYLSYALVSIAADFRYMYPATLWVQTVGLAFAFGSLAAFGSYFRTRFRAGVAAVGRERTGRLTRRLVFGLPVGR